MPTLNVSETVFQRIQRFAVPLVDTHDSVLMRILDAAERYAGGRPVAVSQPAPSKAPAGSIAPRPAGRRERTNHILLRKGLFEPGTRLVLILDRVPGVETPAPDDPRFRCRVSNQPTSRHNVIWDHDGKAYSLSALTELLRDREGVPLSSGALNGYALWGLESTPGQSLWELANSLSGGE